MESGSKTPKFVHSAGAWCSSPWWQLQISSSSTKAGPSVGWPTNQVQEFCKPEHPEIIWFNFQDCFYSDFFDFQDLWMRTIMSVSKGQPDTTSPRIGSTLRTAALIIQRWSFRRQKRRWRKRREIRPDAKALAKIVRCIPLFVKVFFIGHNTNSFIKTRCNDLSELISHYI